jgi:hypothetical protein
MPLKSSLMFVCICIDVGDPVEGRCWDAIKRKSSVCLYLTFNGIPTPALYWIANINTYIDKH